MNCELDSSRHLLTASCKPGKTKFKWGGFKGGKKDDSGVQINWLCITVIEMYVEIIFLYNNLGRELIENCIFREH